MSEPGKKSRCPSHSHPATGHCCKTGHWPDPVSPRAGPAGGAADAAQAGVQGDSQAPPCGPAPVLSLRRGSPAASLTLASALTAVTHLREEEKGAFVVPALARGWRVSWAAPPPGGRGAPEALSMDRHLPESVRGRPPSVKPQQRMGLFVQPAQEKGKFGHRDRGPGEASHCSTAAKRGTPFLVEAWLGFLLSASPRPRVCCVLKIEANICSSPFVRGLFISLVRFSLFPYFPRIDV